LEFAAIKGFKDILPHEVGAWHRLESEARRVFRTFGFKEIRLPLMERTDLFSRSIGQDTDIVSKEMYSLSDSKGRGLTLRPEATASVVRAYIQHRLYQDNPVQKLFTIGPMFRHERPQKGRQRQFHQIDAEVLGDEGPRSDAEVIQMAMALFDAVGVPGLDLRINSLGCPQCRIEFREAFRAYLHGKGEDLCADCRRRTESNPLRVFDCKVDACKGAVSHAPSILQFICKDCEEHFESLKRYLGSLGVPFGLDPHLVRGLDYYNRTTFEIQTDRLGAQNAVAGGGRYDGLSKLLGGPDHPAMGFAVGVERAVALLDAGEAGQGKGPDLFMAALGDNAERACFGWAAELRKQGIWVEMSYGSKGLKSQMKKAHRLGAKQVLMVGEEELASGTATLRHMTQKVQQDVDLENLTINVKELMDKWDKIET
jgi:histidyl-tRNA synthetase